MPHFPLKRLGGARSAPAIVAVLVFLLTRLASGDPVALLLGDQATAADIAAARVQTGWQKLIT
ncbi:Dipeptide transport system permease protein DppB OS=Castellaniella defragrans (strain DSM /CCUG 39792 / 65Phen) OX=1437824 GN=BN940_01696 PE=3 SV=1 [Castellaniella denitrificans]